MAIDKLRLHYNLFFVSILSHCAKRFKAPIILSAYLVLLQVTQEKLLVADFKTQCRNIFVPYILSLYAYLLCDILIFVCLYIFSFIKILIYY